MVASRCGTRWWLTSTQGKAVKWGWKLRSPAPLIGEGEREQGSGPRKSVSSRTGESMACIGFPCCETLTGGPQSGFEQWHELEQYRAALFINPAN
jgi:hypothetical protein